MVFITDETAKMVTSAGTSQTLVREPGRNNACSSYNGGVGGTVKCTQYGTPESLASVSFETMANTERFILPLITIHNKARSHRSLSYLFISPKKASEVEPIEPIPGLFVVSIVCLVMNASAFCCMSIMWPLYRAVCGVVEDGAMACVIL